ncbi:MAG: acyl-CoA synthetase [Saprospiraceae bacterium]|nr:acyl-CoA synthetase [Saprospiraceae bacterium]
MLKIIQQAQQHLDRTAIVAGDETYSYRKLVSDSAQFAAQLLDNDTDLNEQRVAFMVNAGFDYVRVQWGIWQAGGVAVPLCLTHPLPSLRYTIDNSEAETIVVSPEYADLLRPLADENGLRFIVLGEIDSITEGVTLPSLADSRRAMILYTSGTTNLPKGVVTTHANLNAQITALVEAWEWTAQDHTICVLPLHHVHGIVNIISCAMWSGACCEFLPQFSAENLFNAFRKGKINVFMAVPTIYFKLIAHWESLPEAEQQALTDCLSRFRFMVSGSAALPVSVMEKWAGISQHTLLERYGMTEIGMGLSNPYRGKRYAGHVGYPLPNVQVRLADENDRELPASETGEIQIKGPNVFSEYWRRPEATAEAFTQDGWFKTGDVATVDTEGGYRILGRNSVDIIKSGGYKISALEIEEVLRTHPLVSDCSVVGIDNDEWGELVVAAIVPKEEGIDTHALNTWMRTQMPTYKTPRQYKTVAELPRNAMGKVTKNDVKKLF